MVLYQLNTKLAKCVLTFKNKVWNFNKGKVFIFFLHKKREIKTMCLIRITLCTPCRLKKCFSCKDSKGEKLVSLNYVVFQTFRRFIIK